MASTILFVLFVSLLLRGAFLLPISQDVKSVQDVEQSARTVFDIETMFRRDKNTEQVKSLGSVYIDKGVKRTKRQIIVGNHRCPDDMVWFGYRCVSLEQYERLKDEDEE